MATHDYVISNASGASVRADLNNALAAIVSNNSNATSPSTTYAYQFWADTTTGQLKIRNAANSAWITLMELDGTMLMEDGSVSAPGLAFASDTNTGFFRSAADKINFATGGAERLEIGSSEVVFNDPGNDVDFRVESNGNANMLFVDAGNDRVGIGTSSPGATLSIEEKTYVGPGFIRFLDNASSQTGTAMWRPATDTLAFNTNSSERLRIDSSGRLGVGTTSPQSTFHLNTSSGSSTARISSSTNTDGLQITARGDGTGCQIAAFGTSSDLRFFTTNSSDSTSEALRIDSSGRALVGAASARSIIGITPKFEVEGTGSESSISIIRNANSSANPYLMFAKSRGTTTGSNTAVQSGDFLGQITFAGADGTDLGSSAAAIHCQVDTTPGSNDMPGRLVFSTTANGASSPTEHLRINNAGEFRSQSIVNTTSSASANMYIHPTNFIIHRSTSSIKYKTNVETLEDQYADALLNCRPVWYQSKCKNDDPDWGHWGFIAEEVAEIDPRLVSWKTHETSCDENGEFTQTPLETPDPEGVQYDRFVPHLLNLIKRQQAAIETLEAKVAALEAG